MDRCGGSIRYCPDKEEWFFWDGHFWTARRWAIVELAKKTVRTMHLERNHILKLSERHPESWELLGSQADALHKWAMRSEGEARITAMIHLAESDSRIIANAEDFDKNPWLLNASNGVIELRTGRLLPHRPDMLLMKNTGQIYDPDARCDRWQKFLKEVFEPHPEAITFLQKAVGYTLTGDTREECVFVLIGDGRNGKSTVLEVMQQILGSYGGVAEIEAFLVAHRNSLREDIADLQGRRYVSVQEPPLTSTFSESTLKWLSGGDRLRARRLWEHAHEFQPSHKLWFAVNRLPAIRRDDFAAWSRIRLIPFDVSFRGREDRELKHELTSEANGILRWAVHGCLMWQKTGLGSSFGVNTPGRNLQIVGHGVA